MTSAPEAVGQGVQGRAYGLKGLAPHGAGPVGGLRGGGCGEGEQAGDLVLNLQCHHVDIELGVDFHRLPPIRQAVCPPSPLYAEGLTGGVFLFYTFLNYSPPWRFEFDPVKWESNLASHGHRRRCSMKAREFDAAFDDNEVDIVDQVDFTRARRPGRDVQRVNVDFPTWMVTSLDAEATRLGITRQAIIKTWIAERLDHSTT